MPPTDLADYRRRAEQFIGALEEEHYLHFSGQKDDCDSAAVYGAFPELFSRATLDELNGVYPGVTDLTEKRRLAYLLTFMTEGYIGEQLKESSDRIANAESSAAIEVGGEEIGYRYAAVVQANEADRERRRRIHRARLDVMSRDLNPLYDELWRRAHAIAVDLGYSSYADCCSEIKAVDLSFFKAEMQAFLQDTEGVYQRSLDKLSRAKLGLPIEELEISDLPYLFRAPEYDAYFTAERLVPTLYETLAGMGIDLAGQPNIHMDTEVRQRKSPRAFCSPVRVPDELYLCVMPQGGQDDYQSLLHEAGHAEHFAHVSRDQPFEFRYLGDNSVTEGFAFIFDHLVYNRHWLERQLGYTDARDYIWFGYIGELYMIRRYIGKLIYEIELHEQNGSLDSLAQVYSRELGDATVLAVPPESYLTDVDSGFYVVNYLRAWMFEGAMRMILQSRHSREWFRNPAAGDFLKQLWAVGQEFNSAKLLLKHGGGRLDADPLLFHIEGALGR